MKGWNELRSRIGIIKRRIRRLPLWAIFISGLITCQLLFVYALFIEPNWIVVRRVKIVSPRLAQVLEGVRVVHISDLHVRELGYREMSLVEKVNRLKPDVVLVTGDLLGIREGIQTCWNVLNLMEPKFWIYGVTGEKDHMYVRDLLRDEMWKRSGTTFIDGMAIKVNWRGEEGGDLWLVGVEPGREPGRELSQITADIPEGEPVVVLSHLPGAVKEAAVLGLPLVLAGDTHGGQVNPYFIRRFLPVEGHGPYVAGAYRVKDTILYVNRGIGAARVNMRFLCWPEITVYDFVSEGRMKYKVLRQDRID